MHNNLLDRLIKLYVKAPEKPLAGLEREVWQRIHARQAAAQQGWPERLLDALLLPKYRFATIVLAILLGLAAGGLTGHDAGETSPVSLLNMQVFSAQDSHLPSSVILSRPQRGQKSAIPQRGQKSGGI